MIVEDLIPFFSWLPTAGLSFLIVASVLIVLGCLFGYVVASFRYGPTEGFYVVSRVVFQAVPDILSTSPRRVWAIAKLAIRETVRRRVLLVAFAIFGILILFGGWFLETNAEHPERVYIGFLGWGTQLLVIMLGLMISTFSLPADIKNKTIYTVTTKPVRATEIVLGRIVGFAMVGTLLLSCIWFVSYFFIMRGLEHTHTLEDLDVQEVVDGVSRDGGRVSANALREGYTSIGQRHRHQVEFFAEDHDHDHDAGDGHDHGEQYALVNKNRGHVHSIGMGNDGTYTIGSPEGNLLARVPIYAEDLNFFSRTGDFVRKAFSVGNDWDYRSYIDGGTSKAAAIFSFFGLKESQFDEGDLPLNVQVQVYRSHKGDVEQRVTASLNLRSKQRDGAYFYETVEPIVVFETEEYEIQTVLIPRQIACIRTNTLTDPPTVDKEPVVYDFFNDIAEDGKVNILLSCNNQGQYIGVAKKDVFFRPRNNGFFQNFLKAYLGIWLQMLVVVSLGVMFSTFLSSIVAMLSTLAGIVLGLNADFLTDVATNQVEGGGPLESFYRIVTQQNMVNPLEEGAMSAVVKSADLAIVYLVNSLAQVMPDYEKINYFNFLAEGYNIEWQRLLIGVVLTLTFCMVTTIAGYFILKTREIAA